MTPQPPYKVQNIRISPHPTREPFEIAQGLQCRLIRAATLNVTIDSQGVGPIRFPGNDRESLLLNEPFRYLRPCLIEFMRSMRRLAQQHEFGVTDQFQQRIIIRSCARQRMRHFPQIFDIPLLCNHSHVQKSRCTFGDESGASTCRP